MAQPTGQCALPHVKTAQGWTEEHDKEFKPAPKVPRFQSVQASLGCVGVCRIHGGLTFQPTGLTGFLANVGLRGPLVSAMTRMGQVQSMERTP